MMPYKQGKLQAQRAHMPKSLIHRPCRNPAHGSGRMLQVLSISILTVRR